VKTLLIPASAILAATLASCGAGSPDEASVAAADAAPRPAAQASPPPALAPGTLASIADVPAGHRRIGYVNVSALNAFGGPLSTAEISRLVLGAGASRAKAPAKTVVQVGTATVVDGEQRDVVGGSAALREPLTPTSPQVSLITEETPSAVQSCLADGAAQVIVGSAVMGRSSAVGAALVDSEDLPKGRKLLICAAPHFVRDLDPTLARLRAAFPTAGTSADTRPLIGEMDIGERDIVRATVSVATIKPSLLRDLIAGGPALTRLAGR
jgi:hypothetical protein